MSSSALSEISHLIQNYTQVTPASTDWANGTFTSDDTWNLTTEAAQREIPEPPPYLLGVVTLIYGLIFVTGVSGNALVIFVLWYHKDMRSYTNWLLGNLSLADLLVILVCMPTAVLDLYAREVWYLGLFMCKLVSFLENSVAISSVLTILSISFERYNAICNPLQAHAKCSTSRMIRIITAIWITSLVTCSPFVVITVQKDSFFLDGTPIKVCRTYIGTGWQRIYVFCLSGIFFFLALILLLALYGLIVRRLLCSDNISKCDGDSTGSSSASGQRLTSGPGHTRDRARRQGAIMIFAVIVLFFVCLLPMQVVRLLLVINPQKVLALGFEGYLHIIYFVRVMFYLNSMVNPLCYNILSSRFRLAFLRACRCGRARHQSPRRSPTHVTSYLTRKDMDHSTQIDRKMVVLSNRVSQDNRCPSSNV